MAKTKTEAATPDLWSAAERTRANLKAMEALARGVRSAQDRAALQDYSGWGGLSIKKVTASFPEGVPKPSPKGLIHEYYTPSLIARAVAEALDGLDVPSSEDGVIRALEPSAGIGRFIEAIGDYSALSPHWTAVEMSPLSSQLLEGRWPDLAVSNMPFEQWAAEHSAAQAGTFQLVVANPPYGPRGATVVLDRSKEYRKGKMKTAAALYFLRRGLDLLAPGGVGVYLIPYGFLTGGGAALRELRSDVLRRHHLMGAFRLPSDIFPGAQLVTDLLFFRARGGVAPTVPEGDQRVLDGHYFNDHPAHILGVEEGKKSDDDVAQGEGKAGNGRWYKVIGNFEGLPAWKPRPMAEVELALQTVGKGKGKKRGGNLATRDLDTDTLGDAILDEAASLGRRVDRWLSLAASVDTPDAANQRDLAWGPLKGALSAWVVKHGNPHRHDGIEREAQERPSIERFRLAFLPSGDLIPALDTYPPPFKPPFREARTPAGVLTWLWNTTNKLVPLDELVRGCGEHMGIGAQQAHEAIARDLLSLTAGFALDQQRGSLGFVHLSVFFSGQMWPRFDRQVELAASASAPHPAYDTNTLRAIFREQGQEIENRLGLLTLEEFDVDPTQGWMPIEVVGKWAKVRLTRKDGLVTLARKDGEPVPYLGMIEALREGRLSGNKARDKETLRLIGWLNSDAQLFIFRTVKDDDGNVVVDGAEEKMRWIRTTLEKFEAFVSEDGDAREAIERAYNRANRGFLVAQTSDEPLHIARWVSKKVPHDYQNRSARRVMNNNGGIIALDVGLGKTLTGLLVIGRALQEGRIKRPVILVPKSLAAKWKRDVLEAYPDMKVDYIGVNEKPVLRGPNKGKLSIVPDDAAERGRKWSLFQAGHIDLIILTYPALGRTRTNHDKFESFVARHEGIARQIAMDVRNEQAFKDSKRGRTQAAQRAKDIKEGKKVKRRLLDGLTERQEAVSEQVTEAWIALKLEIDEAFDYDEGVAWDDIGIDFLMIDEGQNYKNLYYPESPIEFMGSGVSSARPWHLALRSMDVQSRGGMVVILSATPAKNSPLEFYSLLDLVNPQAFAQMGIMNSEQFISRFIATQTRMIPKADGTINSALAAVGFKNLDELRAVINRWCEFKTAEEVGLPLPEVESHNVQLAMTAEQLGIQKRLANAYIEESQKSAFGEDGGGPSGKILGILANMALNAIHPRLTDREDTGEVNEFGEAVRVPVWSWANADTLDDFASPKLLEVVKNVLSRKDCGHIVFVENLAVHRWMHKALIAGGVKPARIGFLNGSATPQPDKRLAVADRFNGDADEGVEPQLDVVICNQVAYEGIDLQARTCAIHHVDIPWEPATLQQRNGRGVRQGNTLGTVAIFYYVHPGTIDSIKLSKIQGKRAWMTDLVKGQDRATNNPFARASDTGDEDLLRAIYGDRFEEAARVIALNKAQLSIGLELGQMKQAAQSFKSIKARLVQSARSERKGELRRAQSLKQAARRDFDNLEKVPLHLWPWRSVHAAVFDDPEACLALAMTEPPTWDKDGMVSRHKGGSISLAFQGPGVQIKTPYGTYRSGRGNMAARRLGTDPEWSQAPDWTHRPPKEALDSPIAYLDWQRKAARLYADALAPEASDPLLDTEPDRIMGAFGWRDYEYLKFYSADEGWLARFWAKYSAALTAGARLKGTGLKGWDDNLVMRNGELVTVMGTGGDRNFDLISPGRKGYEEAAALAPQVPKDRQRVVQKAAERWFGRPFPLRLFEVPAAPVVPVAPVVPAAPPSPDRSAAPPSEASGDRTGRIKAKLEAARVRRSLVSIKTRAVSEGVSASLLTMIERLETVLKSKEMELAA